MIVLVTAVICFLNVINLFMKKKSKLVSFLMIAFLCVMMGANTQNPDIYAYQLNYEKTNLDSLEYGYWFFKQIFIFLGLDYKWFRIITSAIGILLINNTVKKVIKNESAFYLMYFIYPFLLDVVQVRNFLAMAILIFSTPYLVNDDKGNSLKAIIFILLAMSFQTSAIIYLPMIFFIKKKKNKIFILLFIEIVILLVIFTLNNSILNSFSEFLINIFGNYEERISIFAYKQTNLGFILFWFIQLMNFILMYWSNKNYNDASLNPIEDSLHSNIFQKKYIKTVYWINIYAFFFLPFYVFQSTFSRFMRNLIPLNILAYIAVSNSLRKKSLKKIFFIIIYFTYNIFLFYVDIYYLYNESIVEAVLKYNWILK